MKNIILSFTAFAVLCSFIACSGDDDPILPICPDCEFTCIDSANDTPLSNDCQDNHDCTFTVHKNSGLDFSEPVSEPVISGNKLVFKHFDSTEGSPNIADDEFTLVTAFEIDPELESFSVESDQLDDINLRFVNLCFCAEVEYKTAASGCAEGQKIDENFWKVQINADFEYANFTKTVQIDAVFEVQ